MDIHFWVKTTESLTKYFCYNDNASFTSNLAANASHLIAFNV